MGDSIGDIAKSWLADPPWQRVFKHTFDVIADYVTYILVAIGGVALSVRLLTTLATGDLNCIIVGVLANDSSLGSLDPYPAGSALGFINYASTDQTCISAVFTPFMEHMPYILLLQTLVLIIVEKFTFKIPRIAQKVERFYQNIVEESLFGKDPDVAEDMYDAKTSTEAISRRRQRNEICVTLKRSSIIHDVYIGKNCVKVLLVFLYLLMDVSFYVGEHPEENVKCDLPVYKFPKVIEGDGIVQFQCHGKKTSFFMMAMIGQIVLLGMHGLCSIGAILWCLFFRSVTRLLSTIESMKRELGTFRSLSLEVRDGKDFLFLFDLLAHTSGLDSTLRVLTHSDEKFYEICKPSLDVREHLILEEDKLKIMWGPADIERWLQTGKKSSSNERAIEIDSYEVTIFPAESVKNVHTLPAHGKSSKNFTARSLNEPMYHTWFYDLHGGRREYVITIACMIGKSRMKGEKVVTNLVPYGPEKPRSGMVKIASSNQVEIFWDPPKGDFTKYYLYIDHMAEKDAPRPEQYLRLSSAISYKSNDTTLVDLLDGTAENTRQNVRVMENISSKLTTYTILGLEPGESYKIELGTKTGTVSTRQSITDLILTRPLAPKGVRVTDVTTNSCLLAWLVPTGHSSLRGFQIHIKSADGKTFKDVAVTRASKSFVILGLGPGLDYDISLTALCVAEDGKRTESDPTMISTTTQPEKIRNLRLDNATANSLTIKWDAPVVSSNYKYKLNISGATAQAPENDENDSLEFAPESHDTAGPGPEGVRPPRMVEFSSSIEVPGDKTQYTIAKLPEIVGTGYPYTIEVSVIVTTQRENEVTSNPVSGVFVTRPLAPTNLKPDKDKPRSIVWHKSMTPYVHRYRVRWKPSEETVVLDGSIKNDEAIVGTSPQQEGSDSLISFTFPPTLIVGAVYKVNVYSVVDAANQVVESKELHEKFYIRSENELVINVEDPKEL